MGSDLVSAIPADALVMLVGPAGSGKSTWAAGRFDSHEILESDAFRLMVADDAEDQTATADAFKLLHGVARARTRRGLRTIVDATNLTVAARRALVRLAGRAERPSVAVVFDVSLERCLRQNGARHGRRVPDDVVHRHHAQLQGAKRQIPGEGFWLVIVLAERDLDERDVGPN